MAMTDRSPHSPAESTSSAESARRGWGSFVESARVTASSNFFPRGL
jgi:hypothetical protein